MANTEKKKNINTIEAQLHIPSEANDEIRESILTVLKHTRFNKISIQLTTLRNVVDSSIDKDDTHITTVGYIKKFDSKTEEFTVVLFNNYASTITAFKKPIIVPTYSEYEGKLGTIIRLNIFDDEVSE